MLPLNIFWCCYRYRYTCLAVILVQCLIVIHVKYHLNSSEIEPSSLKIIMSWTSEGDKMFINCNEYICLLTSERAAYRTADAVLFYASTMNLTQMPVPRPPQQLWVLTHEESPQNVPPIKYEALIRHFNITSTVSRYSDYPLTTNELGNRDELCSTRYLVPIETKNHLRSRLAPILFLQSDCNPMTRRDEYVQELMQYVTVDSYGKCLNNRAPPLELLGDYLNRLYEPSVLSFMARYKFILAIENGVCYDYITEKFWRPLVVGAIPIYFGAPNVRDWQPNNHSVIHIRDFKSAKELANYILYLDKNDTAYEAYLRHKHDHITPIPNELLQNTLLQRFYSQDITCAVCKELYKMPPGQRRAATQRHYDCPWSLVSPPVSAPEKSFWKERFKYAEWEAKVYDELWQRNQNYTEADVRKLIQQYEEAERT